MRIDPHPLRDGQIQPGPEPSYEVDPRSVRSNERALPSARAMRQHPSWRWGRRVDRPSNSGAPTIMSPSALEPGRGRDDEHTPSIDDVRRRLKP
jgi:hypothetical protein